LKNCGVTSMGASSSIEQGQPVRGGPSHEPSPPDAAQAHTQRAALKNAQNLKHGESRKLKAAALGIHCLIVFIVLVMSVGKDTTWSVCL